MATTGTGQGSSGMGTTDWSASSGGVGETRDRRAAGEGSTGGGIAQTLKDTTYRSIDDQKARASETLGSLAGAVRVMSQPLRDGGQPQFAEYVNKAADGIERWASNLRQQDLEDAVRAVQQFARRQPAMFLGLAFGTGLIAARFFKSSGTNGGMRQYDDFDTTPGGPSSLGSTAYGGGSGLGSTDFGGTGTGATNFGTGATGSTSGDIPRVSGDIRPAGEVL